MDAGLVRRRGAALNANELVRSRVRELARWLRAAPPGEAEVLPAVTRALASALGTEQTVAYGLDTEGEHVKLAFLTSPYRRIHECRREVASLVQRLPAGFAHYDPRCPSPEQRNTVVSLEELHRITHVSRSPILRLLAENGVETRHQLRVLVCDGPALLAWVGAFRDRPFAQADRAALEALVRPLRDRLTLERRLNAVPWSLAALEAALDGMGAAAVVVRRPLSLLFCNAPARALVEHDRDALLVGLREELEGRGDGTWIVTPLGLLAGARHWLALRRRPPRDPSGPAAAAAHRYRLTKAQRAVLELLATGEANKTIAAALGCSESAVEQHVTALLRRYDVDSRARLVARFWMDAR